MPWSEYWSFLDAYCNLQDREGLDKLEIYFQQKKFQQVLDSQIRATQAHVNDLNGDGGSLNHDVEHLISKLKLFIQYAEQLKGNLDLKENQLSSRYERFAKFMKENPNKNLSDLLKTGSSDDSDLLLSDPSGLHQAELAINDTLTRYMSVIIELSRIDKSSRSYFNLYKTSKVLLEMANCQELYDSFYLSPMFQNRTVSLTSDASVRNSQQKSANVARANFMGNLPKSISFDDEEEEERDLSKKKQASTNGIRIKPASLDEEEEDDENENRQMFDAEDSLIEDIYEQKQSNDDDDELDFLTNAFKANRLDSVTSPDPVVVNKPKTNKNPFGGSSNAVEFVNAKENRQPGTNQNVKTANFEQPAGASIKKSAATVVANAQLFVFGDAPSKLDRAVYLAIQELNERARYPLIADWFDYMKNCKQSEMQQWKTPARKSGLSKLY